MLYIIDKNYPKYCMHGMNTEMTFTRNHASPRIDFTTPHNRKQG